MRQRAVLKSILNTLTLNELLSEQGYHLRDVLRVSLRARINHLNNRIVLRQTLDHLIANLCCDSLQCGGDAVLQLISVRGAGNVDEHTTVNIGEDLGHRSASLIQLLSHELLCRIVRNQVRSSYREASVQIELRDHRLDVIDQLSASLRAEIIVDHVNQVATRRLLHDTGCQLSILDCHCTLQRQHGECSRDQFSTRPVAVLASEATLDSGEDVHCDHLGN